MQCKDNFQDLVVDGMIIRKHMLNKQGVECALHSCVSPATSCYGEGNEHSCFMKSKEFLDQLGDYKILMEGKLRAVSWLVSYRNVATKAVRIWPKSKTLTPQKSY